MGTQKRNFRSDRGYEGYNMTCPKTIRGLSCAAALTILAFTAIASAQQQRPVPPATQPAAQPGRPAFGRGPQGPVVVSPEVGADRHVTFRIFAPQAENVKLSAGDISGSGQRQLTKGENGVWETTVGPLDPGAYRYNFNVNGLAVIDPRSPSISESNNNVWSVVYVPGSDFMDTTDVPHGAVASVYYRSTALGRTRRMHVYIPPGYETGDEKYPVFYLLHGAGDSDDSWTSVGRANFILDNLIAARKARPMIVVMPAGHTSTSSFIAAPSGRAATMTSDFENDFLKDLIPYVEGHYRVLAERRYRAIAGLSMSGGQTLSIAISHPQQFDYVGVFSSGLFQRNPAQWETEHQPQLDDAAAKQELKLFWFRTGKDDFLLQNTRRTVELLRKHGFNIVFEESSGAHTWINWRNYLNEFAPQLFQ